MEKISKFFKWFIPPDNWKLPVILALGVFTGLVFLLLHISRAGSYISDKPETCINCHVMYPYYASWQHSSHSNVAICNDCHVPHDNFIRKYMFKASDGLRHSTMFTLRLEPQVIRIKEAGANVVQENCERCHSALLSTVDLVHNMAKLKEEDNIKCWTCHREVPHGKVNSLSSSPNARVPKLNPVLPDWLHNLFKKDK